MIFTGCIIFQVSYSLTHYSTSRHLASPYLGLCLFSTSRNKSTMLTFYFSWIIWLFTPKKKKSSRSESIKIFLLKYPVPPYSLPEGWQYIWSISVTAPMPTLGVTVIFPWSLLSAMILCSRKTSIHCKKFWKYRKRDENHLHNQRHPKHVTVRNGAWFSIARAPPQLITLKTFFYAIKQFFRPSFKRVKNLYNIQVYNNLNSLQLRSSFCLQFLNTTNNTGILNTADVPCTHHDYVLRIHV